MNISLPSEYEKYVQSQIDSGLYPNANELIKDAIRAKAEQVYQLKLQNLREALAPGIKACEEGDTIEYSSLEEFLKDMESDEEI